MIFLKIESKPDCDVMFSFRRRRNICISLMATTVIGGLIYFVMIRGGVSETPKFQNWMEDHLSLSSKDNFQNIDLPLDAKRYNSSTPHSNSLKRRRLTKKSQPFIVRGILKSALKTWELNSSGKKKVHILLICYWRGGSTFLSDVLQHYSTSFFSFEPFHYLENRSSGYSYDEVQSVLRNLITCNYKELAFLMDWMERNSWLLSWNKRYWALCRLHRRETCFRPEFAERVCNVSVLNLIKTIRVRMQHAYDLLKRPPDGINLKVIHLERDPRGIFSSRKKLPTFCEDLTDCPRIKRDCDAMKKDNEIANLLKLEFPENFMQIKYEDFSRNTVKLTKRIFEFAELDMNHRILKHLKYNIAGSENDKRNPYSTRRNSTYVWSNWTEKLNFTEIMSVQNVCGRAIEQLGYKLVTDETQLLNFHPIL